MKTVYKCERCGDTHPSTVWIFNCCDCGKETCDSCMYGWATCKDCVGGRTRQEIEARFNKANELTPTDIPFL